MFITGVIGYPLKMTFSPLLHNNAFIHLGLSGQYFPLSVPEQDFETIIKTIKKLKFAGLNITNPYKMRILKYLDGVSPVAKKIGAVNTVVIRKNKLFGENTDIYGFDKSLKEHNINITGKKIMLIGAGGVARAIAYVIFRKKPQSFFITNRTKIKSLYLTKKYNGQPIDFKDIFTMIRNVDVVINGTSIDIHNLIFPHMKDGSVYYDTNYRFNLLNSQNILVVNGITMLIYQAAFSFSIWTGRMPPVNIMKNAIKEVQIG